MKTVSIGVLRVFLLASACIGVSVAQEFPDRAKPCDEFLSSSPCYVTYNMKVVAEGRAPTHSDVQTKIGGNAWVRLTQASPFLACTIQATPGAPARDLSSSVTTALTSVAGLAALPVASEVSRAQIRAAPSGKTIGPDLQRLQKTFKDDLKDWKYTFANNSEVRDTLDKLGRELNGLLQQEGELEAEIGGPLSAADLADLRKFRDAIAQRLDVINAASDPKNSGKRLDIIELAMDRFRQKTVSETITCKDAATGTQPFPTMTFTAYYENTPIFDISAGAVASLTPGRQVGTVSSPFSPSSGAPMGSGTCLPANSPATCLEETSHSDFQFMPAVFFELHAANWRWPWAKNGRAYHRFGYVGSIGPAIGIAINPNNGSAEGEFFEGVSIGIQRVALMIGAHNGRYQTFADGYYVGEEVPTAVTPRTERGWTTHLAFGISYRIALH